MRILPITPHISRTSVKDYKVPGTNVVLPKGSKIHVPLNAIHHDPEFFPNPDEFDPLRFTKENIAKRHACSFMPFGDGPRNCIGLRFGMLETKIAVAVIIREFKLSRTKNTCNPMMIDPKTVVAVPKDAIWWKVEKI